MNAAGGIVRETGTLARAMGQYIGGSRQRAREIISSSSPVEPVDDLTLKRRVRAELEHSGNPNDLHVAVSSGVVTLTGHCQPGKISEVLNRVENVQGVQRIRNELRAYDVSSNAPEAARSAPDRPAV